MRSIIASLGKSAFSGCKQLKRLQFADDSDITVLPEGLCEGCIQLAEINWSALHFLSAVGDRAFDGCPFVRELQALPFPEQALLDELGYRAFACGEEDAVLRLVEEKNGFVVFGGCLYRYRGNDTVVRLPDGVQSISAHAFDGQTSVEAVTVSGTLRCIGAHAFRDCESLFYFNMDRVSGNIGSEAFADSTLLVFTVNNLAPEQQKEATVKIPYGEREQLLRQVCRNFRSELLSLGVNNPVG